MAKRSKTVRLEEEILSYIDGIPGKDFTEKLVYLTEEYRSGDQKRKEDIDWYNRQIKKLRKELYGMNGVLSGCERLRSNLSYIERIINSVMEDVQRAGEDLPGAYP